MSKKHLDFTPIFALLSMLILLIPLQKSFSWWPFEPKNFDDCLEKYQKHSKMDNVAGVIHRACYLKFKKKGNIGYADCLLENIEGTESKMALNGIIRACQNINMKNDNINYSECLLRNLKGIQSDTAARSLIYSCQNRFLK